MGYFRFYPHRRDIRPPLCYKVSGQVTISGVAQVNALVDCIDEQDLTFVGQRTTDASGNYSFDSGAAIKGGHTYHLTAQYDSGTQKYNTPSLPYVSPIEN